ncbi:MAG TPA: SPOR domain-containing protein [Gaiellaceae bacterium]|nr:SPOR domain-containing protein [Gaiellaceae bacterium]
MEPPDDAPDPSPRARSESELYRCYRCGAPHDPFQEYCLECGARVVPLHHGSWSVWRREAWGRDSPMWFWATFLALLVIALAAAAIVLAATGDDDRDGRGAAAPPGPSISTVGAPTQTGAITTGTLPETFTFPPPTAGTTIPTFTSTVADGTTTSATTTTSPTTATTPTTTGGATTVIAWPAGREGYTVVLASYRHSRGRAFVEDQAEDAIAAGLTDVGVLDSSRFASLEAGYYVVFYGIHDTESEAVSARSRARNAGYTNAYVREVDPG